MSINQKSGRQTFRRRFVSGSLFVSLCPPECYLQSETKIEPDLRLIFIGNIKCLLYSDGVKGDPSSKWLRKYQEEDEEEALTKRVIKELEIFIL